MFLVSKNCPSHTSSFLTLWISSYVSLAVKEAAELLMLSNVAELDQFAKQFDWRTGADGRLVFGKGAPEARVPKLQVMEQTLSLAEELERIV